MSQITFKRPDGKDCSGFYVEPAAGPHAPSIVVIQEWWGVNEQIKGVAKRFAAQGYRALVPDLYRGQLGLDAKEAEHLIPVKYDPTAAETAWQRTLAFVEQHLGAPQPG